MILNGVMAVTLRYFTEFGIPSVSAQPCRSVAEFVHESIVILYTACTMSLKRKFTFAISSPDEFLVHHSLSQKGLLVYSNKWRTESGSHIELAGHFPLLSMQ